jgi:hypothetical protein
LEQKTSPLCSGSPFVRMIWTWGARSSESDDFRFDVTMTRTNDVTPPAPFEPQHQLGNRHRQRLWRTPITLFYAAHLLWQRLALAKHDAQIEMIFFDIGSIREEHERHGPSAKLRWKRQSQDVSLQTQARRHLIRDYMRLQFRLPWKVIRNQSKE